jgi:hypothetical protein
LQEWDCQRWFMDMLCRFALLTIAGRVGTVAQECQVTFL